MDLFQLIFLSSLQGVAEFLPISSSGHLLLFKELWGLDEIPLLFDVWLHLGTLFAILIYYRQRIFLLSRALKKSLFEKKSSLEEVDRQTMIILFGASFITAFFGGSFYFFFPDLFEEPSLLVVSFTLTAILLWISDFSQPHPRSSTLLILIALGFAQSLGVLPGISRSGITIITALMLGLSRSRSAELSFLLAIPAILGAFLLNLDELFSENLSQFGLSWTWMALSFFVSFAVAYLSLSFLIKLLEKARLRLFSFYLIVPIVVSFIYFVVDL